MASESVTRPQLSFEAGADLVDTASGTAWQLLRAAGSLKITVVMFLAATFLLFVGTLAQDEKNLPEVKAEYFNSWVAKIPFSDFLPVTVFGESGLTGWFPFPGGGTIGLVMLVNLIAAKVTPYAADTGKWLLGQVGGLGGMLIQFLLVVVIAAMPLAKLSASSAPSRIARRPSSALTVGFP